MIEKLAVEEGISAPEAALRVAFVIKEGWGETAMELKYPFTQVILHYGELSIQPLVSELERQTDWGRIMDISKLLYELEGGEKTTQRLDELALRFEEPLREKIRRRAEYYRSITDAK